jgi:ADP-ribose pyrophosphatase YjhB (NUDIX family)
VQEKNGPLKGMGVWKVPTGLVDAKEDLHTAACREVKEETGIETEFVGLLCFRHAHNFQFGKSDLFFVCLLKPLSTEITKQESEIAACEWIDFDKYMNQSVFMLSPLHTKLNTFIKLIAEDKDYKNYLERFSLPIGFRPGSNMLYMPMTSIPTSTSASITAR